MMVMLVLGLTLPLNHTLTLPKVPSPRRSQPQLRLNAVVDLGTSVTRQINNQFACYGSSWQVLDVESKNTWPISSLDRVSDYYYY
jgi:hypothetical protein